MAGRPEKHTVDYFPHYTKEGKTLFILESQYKNDGYAFWFKLLTILSGTNNHIFDTRNTADWQFLVAKTLVTEENCKNILDLLASLGAIDKPLWGHGIIWCQNLVDNFTDIYRKRGQSLPVKLDIKTISGDINAISGVGNTQSNAISGVGNTQSKVNKSKVNKSKVNKSKVNKVEDVVFLLPEWVNPEIWAAFIEIRKKKKAVQTPYALKLIMGELERLKEAGNDPDEVLRQSIANSWKGVFPLKAAIQKYKSGWEGE